MRPRLWARHGLAVAGGALAFLSLPPIGWWPAGVAGTGLFFAVLAGAAWPRRLVLGIAFGFGLLVPGLVWLISFTAPGYPLVVIVESSFYALAAVLTPPGRGRLLAFPAAVAAAEMLRDIWPFGGVPLAELSLGQAGGPLLELARLGGSPLMTAGAAALGAGAACVAAGLAGWWRGQPGEGSWSRSSGTAPGRPSCVPRTGLGGGRDRSALRHSNSLRGGLVALALVALVTAAAQLSPDGGGGRPLTVASVQGGGPRGLRAVDRDPVLAFIAQVRAMARVRPGVRLVVWPENVLELSGPLNGSGQDATMRQLATSLDATMVAGVTQPSGSSRFLNEVFAWTPTGGRIGPYEKVHRVPFGEWIPFRSLLSHVANLSDVPRDEVPGHGPGFLRTPAGPLGIMISYEVFFDQRSLAATRAGGQLLLVPTNAASYSSGQVPAMEVAASRIRAVGAGRDLVQAAPTGYSAIIDNRGRVRQRTSLSARAVLEASVTMRRGRTLFEHGGLLPLRLAVVAGLLAGWLLSLARHRRSSLGRDRPHRAARARTGP
jgi:apolipoprotein N-acyltransferase